MPDPIISYPWADEAQTMVDFQRVKVNGELATDLLEQRDRYRAALERINKTLTVPAAEYVPAIQDAFQIIDTALAG